MPRELHQQNYKFFKDTVKSTKNTVAVHLIKPFNEFIAQLVTEINADSV